MRRLRIRLVEIGILFLAAPISSAGCSGCSEGDAILDDATGSGGAPQGGAAQGGDIFATGGKAAGTSSASGAQGGSGGGDESCIFVPPPGQFEPKLDCAWTAPSASAPYPGFDDVVSTPVVINLTDDDGDGKVGVDDIPDIAFISYRLQQDGCCNQPGVLRVVSGACKADGTMTEHLSIGEAEIAADLGASGIWLDNSGGLAAGDIDADGSVDLVATVVGGGTIAFERDGQVKWLQPDHPSAAAKEHLAGTQPALADVDHDGKPEVIQGRVVLNGEDGSLQWVGTAGTGTNAFMGPVVAVGDPDLDGKGNVLAGGTLYDESGNALWSFAFPDPITSGNCQSQGFACDGFTATGNFDSDDFGEIVIVRAGRVRVLEHDGALLDVGGTPADIAIPQPAQGKCDKNEGGPPTVADFDGDGQAEIGVAAADYYVVVDLECLKAPLPAVCSDFGIRWKVANDDCSSRVTGSSVFDFDGDGKAEVVYNDEQYFRVFSGVDGSVLIEVANYSHTRLEMPIVADVDNDGNAEIVFIENASGAPTPTQGIRVWGDANDSWVPTRRIWNQHGYHVTNVLEDGTIPKDEPPNWLEPTKSTVSGKMNLFRQNLPSYDVFAAPDLTVELSLDTSSCPASLGVVAVVCNQGALVVGAGVPVTFFSAPDQPIACSNAPVATTKPLSPGSCETLTCSWPNPPDESTVVEVRACVDNSGYACDSASPGGNNECHEDNNLADATGNGCPGVPQ
jgi:hypothetical protein